ncbi:M50 family metallopeptidase [Kaarinaea lacus]
MKAVTKQVVYLSALLLLVFFLWEYPILYPLKLLVVFFHESSHALATVFTGGQVVEMVVIAQQGGHVISTGGNRFIMLTSGYLGSLFWGVLIYTVATITHFDRLTMFLLGVAIAAITLLFVSNGFAIGFGLVTAVAMILAAKFLHRDLNDFFLRLIGLTSMMYVAMDIYSDTIARSHLRSDARMLSEEYGGATVLWGGLWIALSIVIIIFCLRLTVRIEKAKTVGVYSNS